MIERRRSDGVVRLSVEMVVLAGYALFVVWLLGRLPPLDIAAGANVRLYFAVAAVAVVGFRLLYRLSKRLGESVAASVTDRRRESG